MIVWWWKLCDIYITFLKGIQIFQTITLEIMEQSDVAWICTYKQMSYTLDGYNFELGYILGWSNIAFNGHFIHTFFIWHKNEYMSLRIYFLDLNMKIS